MRDLLGRVGEIALLVVAAPFMVADAVRDVRRSGEDAAAARREALRTEVERDEARRLLETSDRKRIENAATACRLADRVTVLADELRLTAKERDGYRADVAELTSQRDVANRACSELQGEVDTARSYRNDEQRLRLAAEGEVKRLTAALAATAADRDAHIDAKHAKHAEAATPCTWCRKQVMPGWYTRGDHTYMDPELPDGNGPDDSHPLCARCADDHSFSGDDIRARVASRLASCPLRRTSQDPLAADCLFGCGAKAGVPCDAPGIVDLGFGS